MLRFAQSQTKNMDLNDLRVALINFILSKQLNEDLLIRIDDTKKEKNIQGNDKSILETLNLFSIDYSKAVYQSDNIKYHTSMGMKLLLDKKAFNCFCSDEALNQDMQKAKKEGNPYSYGGFCETISDEAKFHCNAPFVVRLKKPDSTIKFNDLINGDLSYEPFEVDSVIILNHSKTPTYDFACAVDDMIYDISTIVRREDYISHTPKQIHIMKSLGYEKEVKYIHIPNITDIDKSVQDFIDDGYLPSAIANYLILLGYDAPKEIFTVEEAVQWFDIKNISKENIEFDIEKLNILNKEYIKNIDDLRLSKILGYADEDLGKLAKTYIEQCNTLNEIKAKIQNIFSQKDCLEDFKEEFVKIKECLQVSPFIEDFEELQKYVAAQTKLEGEKLSIPFCYAITGLKNEQNLKEIYPFIKNYLGEIVK